MPDLAISTVGSGPLVRARVIPLAVANLPARSTLVKVSAPAGGGRRVLTGARLRTTHLIALDSTSSREFTAGVKDIHDVWSEESDVVTLATANFSAGATIASVGSGVDTDLEVEAPTVRFPDLNVGSGRIGIRRTLLSESFYDEVRKQQWNTTRAAFHIVLKLMGDETDIDGDNTAQLLHKWYKTLNGSSRPFLFDYADPASGKETRHVVRFRPDDARLADDLFDGGYHDMNFTLVELIGVSFGGDV